MYVEFHGNKIDQGYFRTYQFPGRIEFHQGNWQNNPSARVASGLLQSHRAWLDSVFLFSVDWLRTTNQQHQCKRFHAFFSHRRFELKLFFFFRLVTRPQANSRSACVITPRFLAPLMWNLTPSIPRHLQSLKKDTPCWYSCAPSSCCTSSHFFGQEEQTGLTPSRYQT